MYIELLLVRVELDMVVVDLLVFIMDLMVGTQVLRVCDSEVHIFFLFVSHSFIFIEVN